MIKRMHLNVTFIRTLPVLCDTGFVAVIKLVVSIDIYLINGIMVQKNGMFQYQKVR
jgi:hypothetical protein